ncbi:alcohol dehydrogenase, propanol-preferring [Tardiphaga sp. OK246]|uniref:zinc-dependent alcohol dehydrogenase family protein n=1 Tax=Tardiphaga sp. OK246 TaxID=1855307 RepID=UPI000B6B513D|nr:zinc-dependent alcohol dehydrogenase family protein [Tardiphaga sp. OK246]SNT43267.1 alcohol dehydrogenase, propanol-preferring [Tardiphaga sp. OK246]
MYAMVLEAPGAPLVWRERPDRVPKAGQVRIMVDACGVCRTDLHVVDGDLPSIRYPIVPGHEIVGRIDEVGTGVKKLKSGDRVGVPWLGSTCGTCPYCRRHAENLCDHPEFTGYTRDGGFATHVIAEARYCFELGEAGDSDKLAPLMCAGLIGWRSLKMAGRPKVLGLYGFGAAAHIIAQVAVRQQCRVYAFTRDGDAAAQDLALSLGVAWAGAAALTPPEELDAAIIFAPAGELVPIALRAVRKGGRVVCAGIHMSNIPSFPYRDLWEERQIVSVANLTRADGEEFLELVRHAPVETHTTTYPLGEANAALNALRSGTLVGAAVLLP